LESTWDALSVVLILTAYDDPLAAVGCTVSLSIIDAGGIPFVEQLVSVLLRLILLEDDAKVTTLSLSPSCGDTSNAECVVEATALGEIEVSAVEVFKLDCSWESLKIDGDLVDWKETMDFNGVVETLSAVLSDSNDPASFSGEMDSTFLDVDSAFEKEIAGIGT